MAIAPVCPKCRRERRPGEDACARCGLLVTRWEGWVDDAPAHPLLDGLWAACEADWQDAAVHDRFLEQATAAGELDVAAARYRAACRQRPGDARAQAGLKRTLVLVENQIEQRPPSSASLARWLPALAALAVAVALLAMLLWPRAHR
jgi:hypothetical protein